MFRFSLPALILLFVAFGAQAASASRVEVHDGWIRLLPGNLPAGAYAQLRNDGDDPATLVSVSSPDYASAMLHRSSRKDGMSRMAMVGHVTVPAGGIVRFSPGGYHVMLMSPTHAIHVGDTVRLHFVFSDGSQADAAFAVRAPNTIETAD